MTAAQKGQNWGINRTATWPAADAAARCIVLDEAGWNEFFKTASIAPHTVVYEHLVDHYEDTAPGVLRFLGIDPPEPLLSLPRRMRRQSEALSEEWYARFVREKWDQ